MRLLFLRCAVGAVVLSFAAVFPAAAQGVAFKPPPINIPEARRKNFLPQDVEQIKKRLTYIAQALLKAKATDTKTLAAARTALTATFTQYREADYRYEVATHAATIVTPVLALDGAARQVNVAMALARMNYAPIQPALEKMVVHPNAAVRYLGWQGYQAARPNIQLRGAQAMAQMFTSLKTRATAETSPRVLSAIWSVLAMKGRGAAVVAPKDRARALKIMTASWRKRCTQVFTGDVAMSRAIRQGVVAAHEHVIAAKKKEAKGAAAQMIVDVMYCAAKALGRAFKADALTGPSGMAAETLLYECEAQLKNMLGLAPYAQESKLVSDVLKNPMLRKQLDTAIILYVNPRTKRKYGVLAWVDMLNRPKSKKGYEMGLATPTEEMFKPPPPKDKPTTKPTTRPAKGTPASRPAKASGKTTTLPAKRTPAP